MTARDPKLYFYDTIADRFDELVNPYDLRRRLEIVFDELLGPGDLDGRSVLDVGCGSGWFSLEAARRVRPSVCRRVVRRGHFLRMHRAHARPRLALREIHRVTRPGGRLLVTVPNQAWHFSATIAHVFKLRPFEGYEHWLGWWEIRRILNGFGARIEQMRGFHLVPPLFGPSWPLLRRIDALGTAIGPVMLNIAVLARKTAPASASNTPPARVT